MKEPRVKRYLETPDAVYAVFFNNRRKLIYRKKPLTVAQLNAHARSIFR